MTVTVSNERTKKIIADLGAGKNLDKITVEEFLNVSFLSLISGDEVHIEEQVMHAGNLYSLHACLAGVNPNNDVKALRNIT